MRNATIERNTAETRISLTLELDGKGTSDIATGCGFLDHMLTLFARHGRFDLTVKCDGDTYVDDHHTVEDIGIALGKAFDNALGEKRGICRYGSTILPMDEALILSAVDLSGRGFLGFDLSVPTEKVGTFDTELVEEFFLAFTRNAQCTLHFKKMAGSNSHHIIEGAFKSVARSLKDAVAIDPAFSDEIPSTKGVL
ncbi:MAG: imidazoleglycerol-phosphate dehydratase HisB [Oscillospiraceae bacterium]|nr:imidazoleglycerol-phosphate dehydratase HisB [Oscillospiraceae bacterium]